MQSVSITTKVVSSNPAHVEVYSIRQYVIKFVSDLRQICCFLRVPRFPPQMKLTPHDIAEIFLKVALNTITPNPLVRRGRCYFTSKYTVVFECHPNSGVRKKYCIGCLLFFIFKFLHVPYPIIMSRNTMDWIPFASVFFFCFFLYFFLVESVLL